MRARKLEGLNGLILAICGLVLAGSAAGCAFVVDTIPLTYGNQPRAPRVVNAERVPVAVNVYDERKDRTRVGCKKNGYGMEMAAIETSTDVPKFVRINVEWELKRRGFAKGANGVVVEIALRRFYNDFKTGFFTGDAVAEVSMDVTALKAPGGPEGVPIYAGHFEGEGRNENIGLASGENAKVALDAAFDDAMKRMFSDRRFLAALAATAAPPEPPPPPPPAAPAAPEAPLPTPSS